MFKELFIKENGKIFYLMVKDRCTFLMALFIQDIFKQVFLMAKADGLISTEFTIRGKLNKAKLKAMDILGTKPSYIHIREIGNLMFPTVKVIKLFKHFHSTRVLLMTVIKVAIQDINVSTNSNIKECLPMTISTAKVKSNT